MDIVAAVTESPNPRKYWSVLKTRLKKAGNELTTRCSQLKMTAADGKRYATDCFAHHLQREYHLLPGGTSALVSTKCGADATNELR